MAHLVDLLDELEETASCSICIAFLNQPKTLPCGHSFCAPCLQSWLGSMRQNNANGPKQLRCPECNNISTLSTEGINDLPTNIRINQILSVIQAHKVKKGPKPVLSPTLRPESRVSLRQRNESIYGTWRVHFLKHCKGEIEQATKICHTRLGEVEQLEKDCLKNKIAFGVSLVTTQMEIKSRVDDFIKKIRELEIHLLEQIESMGQIGKQQYEEEEKSLQTVKGRYAGQIQIMQDWLDLPDRDLIKNYQETCGDLEEFQREPPLNFTMPGGGRLALQLHAPHTTEAMVEMFGTITKHENGPSMSPPSFNPEFNPEFNQDTLSVLENSPSIPFVNANLGHGSNLREITFESLNRSEFMQGGHRMAVEGNEIPPPLPAPRVPTGRSASNLSLNIPRVNDIHRFPSEPVLNARISQPRKQRKSKGCTVM